MGNLNSCSRLVVVYVSSSSSLPPSLNEIDRVVVVGEVETIG